MIDWYWRYGVMREMGPTDEGMASGHSDGADFVLPQHLAHESLDGWEMGCRMCYATLYHIS